MKRRKRENRQKEKREKRKGREREKEEVTGSKQYPPRTTPGRFCSQCLDSAATLTRPKIGKRFGKEGNGDSCSKSKQGARQIIERGTS